MVSKSARLITERLTKPSPTRPYGAGLTKRTQFWMTDGEHERLTAYAEENGVGVGEALRYAIKLLTEEEA